MRFAVRMFTHWPAPHVLNRDCPARAHAKASRTCPTLSWLSHSAATMLAPGAPRQLLSALIDSATPERDFHYYARSRWLRHGSLPLRIDFLCALALNPTFHREICSFNVSRLSRLCRCGSGSQS